MSASAGGRVQGPSLVERLEGPLRDVLFYVLGGGLRPGGTHVSSELSPVDAGKWLAERAREGHEVLGDGGAV